MTKRISKEVALALHARAIQRFGGASGGRDRMSAQAVGGAVGHNEISLIVPCHRVVGANGSLIGYVGGISKKVELLKLEGTWQDGFFVPKKNTAP